MPDNQTYAITEAIREVKKISKEKFDPSVEVHFRLGIDPNKGEQQVRGFVNLPHGSGKQVRVAAFVETADLAAVKEAGADLAGSEDLINQIKTTNKIAFDVAVAQPAIMPKLASIAKILGPKGLMPSPKDGTVTNSVAKAVRELKTGKISFKNDDTGNLHTVIGKKSFDDAQLVENFKALLEAVKKAKPASLKGEYVKAVYLKTAMGRSVKVSL